MLRSSFFSKVSLIEWLRGVTQKNWSRPIRPRRGRFHRLELEFLEDRVAPASLAEAAGVITLSLTANNETVTVFSKGANLYHLTTTDATNGFVTAGLVAPSSFSTPSGSISGDLTVNAADTEIDIVDGAFTGGHIVFADSGPTNAYAQFLKINLTNANAGAIDFFGASTFNSSLSASTTRGNVNIEAGAVVTLNGSGAFPSSTLTQTATGGHIEIDGTIVTTSTESGLTVSAFGSNVPPGINESATGVIRTNAATTATFGLTGAAGTINLNGGPNDFAGPVIVTQSGAGSVTTLSFRNADPAAGLPTLTGLTALTNYTLVTDNTSIVLSNSSNLPAGINFNYTSGGNITQSTALNLGTASFTVLGNNSILLNSVGAGNTIGSVSFNALKSDNTTQVSYLGSAGVNIGASSLGLAAFNITAQGAGNITEIAPITERIGAAGSTFDLLGTGTAITLSNTGNRFEGPIALIGPGSFTTVNLANASLLPTFPAMSASVTSLTLNYPNAPVILPNLTTLLPALANLTVTAQGVFQQAATTFKGNTTSGSTTVSGLTSVAGLTPGQAISGPGIPAGTTIAVVGTNTITLSAAATATATGVTLTAASGITVATNASFSAGNNPIVLDGPNDFVNTTTGGIQVTNAGPNQVVINDVNALNFGVGNSQLGNGTLTVTAGGNITQANRIRQAVNAGQTSFTAAGGSSITLANAANQLLGIVDLFTTGNGSANVNSSALNLGTSVIGSPGGTGTLTVNATGNLTQDPGTTLTVAASSTLTGGNITLDNNGNTFHGAPSASNFVSVNGGNVTIRASGGPINLGASAVTGALIVRAGGGAITQVGAITGPPTSSLFDAGTAAITLTNAGNAFSGVTSASSTGTGTTFKGNTTTGSPTISAVSSTAGLSIGQTVTGPGIPAGTTITAVNTTTVTLSQNATATATSVTLTATAIVQLTAAGTLQVGRINLGTGPGVGANALILTANNISEAGGTTAGITESALAGAAAFTMQQGGGGQNEQQSLAFTATTGSFGLAFDGQVTAPLVATATPAAVQAALQALTSIGAGNVLVTGTPGNYVVKFQGTLANVNVPQLSLVGAGNVVLNVNGTVSLNNANNAWSGLVDLGGATSVTALTLNNSGSLNFAGTPAIAGTNAAGVSLTAGQTITVPDVAYTTWTKFAASAKETYVTRNIATTAAGITFTGAANLGTPGTPLTLTSAAGMSFNGDVNVLTTTAGLVLNATAVSFNQGTWSEGSTNLAINGAGTAFNVGGGVSPATFNMVSGLLSMSGGGNNVNVAQFATFEVGDTTKTNTVDSVTLSHGTGSLTFLTGATLSVGLGGTNDQLVDATGNVSIAQARLTAYSGVTGASASPVLTATAGTVAGTFALTADPAANNAPHDFLMGTDIVTPTYSANAVAVARGGTQSATGTVTGFEPDGDKYVITASTGATAQLTTARDVNGLLDVVVRNAPGAVALTITTTKNLGDGLTQLGGIAVDGPGAATITGTNTDVNLGVAFIGNLVAGSPTVTNIFDVAGLSVGMNVTGTGIAAGSTITAIAGTTVTLSTNATTTITGATLTATNPFADVLVQGPLTALTLRDFQGGTSFQDFIRAGGTNSLSTAITGRVFDSVSISLPTILTALTLAQYTNNSTVDSVTAERFGAIKTTAIANTFVQGDFIVNRLTNLNTADSTTAGLDSASIAHTITGQFDLKGPVTSVTSQLASGFSLGLPGGANNPNGDLMTNVTTLSLGIVTGSNIEAIGNVASTTATSWVTGTLKANSFATIKTTGNATLPAAAGADALFGNFKSITLTATGNLASVGLGALTVAGDYGSSAPTADTINVFNGNITTISAGRQIFNGTVNAGVVTPLDVIVDPVNNKVGTITAGVINGLKLDARLVTSISAVGNAAAGIFGDIIGAAGFNTLVVHGMPNGAPIFTGVGLGTLNATRNLGGAAAGQGITVDVIDGSLTGVAVGYQMTNDDILLLSNAGKLGSLTAGAWSGQAGRGLVAQSIGALTIKGAPLVVPNSPLLIGNLSSVDILAFVNSGTAPGIGTLSVSGGFTLSANGYLRSDNGITSFTVGRDVTAAAAGANLISARNPSTGKVGTITVGRWNNAVASVDFVADTIGTMKVTGYTSLEVPSATPGDLLATNFVLLNTTQVDATSITVGFNQNVTSLLAPGGIGALTVGVGLLGRVNADNRNGSLGSIAALQAGVIGDAVAAATLRAVTFGSIKTAINVPLSFGLPVANSSNGAMNNTGNSVTATSTIGAAGIGAVTIGSYINGGTFNVPGSITSFSVTEDLRGTEVGAGYKPGQSIKTVTVGAIENGVLTSNSIASLKVVGSSTTVLNAGVLPADVTNSVITAEGNVGGVGLGTVTVNQKVINSDFDVAGGNVTAMTVGGVFGSHVLVGAHTAAYDNIVAATAAANWDTLAGVTFTMGSFKTTGLFDPTNVLDTANFRDSFLVAQRLGTVAITGLDPSVPSATTISGGSPSATFGVAFRGTPPGGAAGPKITVSFSNGNPIPALVTQVLVAPTSAGSSVTITGFGPTVDAFRYADLAG
jgi:hypothetical protein